MLTAVVRPSSRISVSTAGPSDASIARRLKAVIAARL
jgi:hypothetical protein